MELHGTTQIHALSGAWGENLDGAVFHAYKFSFSCNVVREFYSGFVLLLQSKLDDDVGNIELELYLVSKIVKASVLSCGEFHMSAEQIIKSKAFQEIFFTGMFGRLLAGSKTSGTQRAFLLQNEVQSLWKPYNSYFLLPLQRLNMANVDSWEIDWTVISSCASIVEIFRKTSSLQADNFCGKKVNLENSDLNEKGCSVSNVISFANCNVVIEGLKDMVVSAIHTGWIYSIVEAIRGASAESTFDGKLDGTTFEYTTFSDYFNKKYEIVLKYPKQPLMRLKQNHYLLVNFNDIGDETLKSGMVPGRQSMHVNMPPELLFRIDIPREVLKSSYLLPSLMHRLESLMLSSQLKKEIGGHASGFKISSHLILEALTTLRCCESFSLERLELLGDSVLKYAVSCHLYLKHSNKHEGHLFDLRRLTVCNANLHKLGISRNLQGYIRDSPFDPRRWCAPGQRRASHIPCKCEVNTLEVPLDSKFKTEDPKLVMGICCDKGHRWMISKTIADCVESLIGAYCIDGGLIAALHVMKWFGIDAEIDPPLLFDAITTATMRSKIQKMDDIATLESKIGYQFVTKGLLLKAITRGTKEEHSLGYCYQWLDFLGDSVLDLLITWHFFHTYGEIDPGEITNLRSASVSNENFALVAVRHNFHPHLQHCSSLLLSQITEYVTHLAESHDGERTLRGTKVSKVLGDLVGSIAGAILIDTKLNLDEVWRIYKPLLSPIVTPDKLELPPLRELNQLCDSLGYFVNEKCTRKGELVRAELRLQLDDILLIEEGTKRSRKVAKGLAASRLLDELKKRGISFSYGSKKRKIYEDVDDLPCQDVKNDIADQKTNGVYLELNGPENHTMTETQQPAQPIAVSCDGESSCSLSAVAINMEKGGPRNSLFKLCRSLDWPMPTFKTSEHRSRTPIEFDEGSETRKVFNSYRSNVILHVPNSGSIECEGHAKADKKSSLDSAALALLYELHRQGKVIIGRIVVTSQKTNGVSLELNGPENHTMTETQQPAQPTAVSCNGESSCSLSAVAINMEKGGPRNSLFKLCRSLDWPMPSFKTSEHGSRTPIEFDEGSETRKVFNSYRSNVILHVPNSGSIECEGHAKADKKSSLDSAALALLYELHRQGKVIIGRIVVTSQKTNGVSLELNGPENHTMTETQQPAQPTAVSCNGESSCSLSAVAINMEKGGPRNSLFKLCRSLDWPMPSFKTSEHGSRTPIEFDEGSETRKVFNSYRSNVILHVPNSGSIECEGHAKADKKSSLDSAALALLYELHRQGKVIIGRIVVTSQKTNGVSLELNGPENHTMTETQQPAQPTAVSCNGESSCSLSAVAINMEKGGPRNSLFKLCRSLDWPMPSFKTSEHGSRTPIEFDEGSETRKVFNSYRSNVILHVPNSGSIECEGHAKADKKSSLDSAALALLYELHRQGKVIIGRIVVTSQKTNGVSLELNGPENHTMTETQQPAQPTAVSCNGESSCSLSAVAINMEKGGPRNSLFKLCRSLDWPMPSFKTSEHGSRTPIEFDEGSETRKVFNSYRSNVILHVPNSGSIECEGHAKADKKSSLDSAALALLYELHRQGKVIIGRIVVTSQITK